jgi:hypothetical protein
VITIIFSIVIAITQPPYLDATYKLVTQTYWRLSDVILGAWLLSYAGRPLVFVPAGGANVKLPNLPTGVGVVAADTLNYDRPSAMPLTADDGNARYIVDVSGDRQFVVATAATPPRLFLSAPQNPPRGGDDGTTGGVTAPTLAAGRAITNAPSLRPRGIDPECSVPSSMVLDTSVTDDPHRLITPHVTPATNLRTLQLVAGTAHGTTLYTAAPDFLKGRSPRPRSRSHSSSGNAAHANNNNNNNMNNTNGSPHHGRIQGGRASSYQYQPLHVTNPDGTTPTLQHVTSASSNNSSVAARDGVTMNANGYHQLHILPGMALESESSRISISAGDGNNGTGRRSDRNTISVAVSSNGSSSNSGASGSGSSGSDHSNGTVSSMTSTAAEAAALAMAALPPMMVTIHAATLPSSIAAIASTLSTTPTTVIMPPPSNGIRRSVSYHNGNGIISGMTNGSGSTPIITSPTSLVTTTLSRSTTPAATATVSASSGSADIMGHHNINTNHVTVNDSNTAQAVTNNHNNGLLAPPTPHVMDRTNINGHHHHSNNGGGTTQAAGMEPSYNMASSMLSERSLLFHSIAANSSLSDDEI